MLTHLKEGCSPNLLLTRGEDIIFDIYHFIKPYSSFIQLLIIGAISAWFSTRFELNIFSSRLSLRWSSGTFYDPSETSNDSRWMEIDGSMCTLMQLPPIMVSISTGYMWSILKLWVFLIFFYSIFFFTIFTTLLSPTPHNYLPHSQLFPIRHESLL